MGVEVSHDDVVITEGKKKVKFWREIEWKGEDRRDVNVMINVDGDIVNDGCNGDVFGDGVTGEEGVSWKVGEDDGVVYEGNKSSITCSTRMVLMDSDIVWKGNGWQVLILV